MDCKLVCSSHSPLMEMYATEPEDHNKIQHLFVKLAKSIRSYKPDLVIVFGCDHYNGFFLDCMPSFCVGTACHAVNDVGGTPGVLNVTPIANDISGALRESGVDVAVSNNMRVDHGFSQTMNFLLDRLDVYPTLPIFINSIAPPYVPFHRSRILGETLGKLCQRYSVKRLLVIGTGGMSHNPKRYYPDPLDAEPEVRHYQLHGPDRDGMSHSDWLNRLESMHEEGAKMLVDGRRTRADIKMNPDLDKHFAQLLSTNRVKELDHWDNAKLVEQGGIGFTELHTWVAATALFQSQCPDQLPSFELYSETLEYGIGFGALSGGF